MSVIPGQKMGEMVKRLDGIKDIAGFVINCDMNVKGKLEQVIRNQYPAVTEGGCHFKWSDIKVIKAISKKPVIVKGIMCADDATIAIQSGADAIWVSNQGGRTTDSAPSSISILPLIASEAKKHSIPVIMDGGVRRGQDVLKAVAYGADLACIGRPQGWALACGGDEALTNMMKSMVEEFQLTMVLTSCAGVKDVTVPQVVHMLRARL